MCWGSIGGRTRGSSSSSSSIKGRRGGGCVFRDPECAGGGIRAGGWVRAEQLAHEGEEVLDVGVGWTCMRERRYWMSVLAGPACGQAPCQRRQ